MIIPLMYMDTWYEHIDNIHTADTSLVAVHTDPLHDTEEMYGNCPKAL